MQLEFVGLSAGITIFSLGLLIISLISYKKYHNSKLLFVSFVFIILLIKGILFSLYLFFPEFSFVGTYIFSMYSGIFDLAILLLLFFSTVKR